MKTVALLDTSICTTNLGDQIIMESVREEMEALLPGAFSLNLQTHDYMHDRSYQLLSLSDYIIVGGTNLLSSNMNHYNQWKIGIRDYFKLRGVILLGVGWWQYQQKPNFYTRQLLGKVLHPTFLHSVRDEFTKNMLVDNNIAKAVNTSCITMWRLDEEKLTSLDYEANSVILTLTDYKPNVLVDKEIVRILKKKYRKVYYWIQGQGDFIYSRKVFDEGDVEYIDPNLKAFDDFIVSNPAVDFIGTRLHAGIRCLQKGIRTLIIGVDNRAIEIARDTGLPVVNRDSIGDVEDRILNGWDINLRLNHEAINIWRKQFE
jgi:polysaccharide pyruvyl transferase WcaK-like protein